MNTKKIIIISVMALVIVGVALGAIYYYTQMPQPVDEASLRIYADPMTENILQAINTVNYTSFSKDLDSTMKSSFTEQTFTSMCSTLESKIGSYVSKVFIRGESLQGYTIAYYNATYTDEPAGVSVKVVFSSDGGAAKISGLWFDSPKLRSS
jgi:hypothetical protein